MICWVVGWVGHDQEGLLGPGDQVPLEFCGYSISGSLHTPFPSAQALVQKFSGRNFLLCRNFVQEISVKQKNSAKQKISVKQKISARDMKRPNVKHLGPISAGKQMFIWENFVSYKKFSYFICDRN